MVTPELVQQCQDFLRAKGLHVNPAYVEFTLNEQIAGEPASSHAGCWISEFLRENRMPRPQ